MDSVAQSHQAILPKAGNGRPPLGLEKMLRIYFLQQWFNLSDPSMEETLYDSESMRRFAGIELGQDVVPDETTILNFRHLLERHGLTKKLFAKVQEHLQQEGLALVRARLSMRLLSRPPADQERQR